MLKTVYKSLVYLSLCLTMSHVQAATNSKVRLAASLGARAFKTTASAAKKHFFTITSAIAFASYVKYQHGKYERRIAPLEKKLKEARARRNNAVKESLDMAAQQGFNGNLVCPQGIVDLVNDYADENTLDDCKATAARAKQMTFKQFARGILQNPFARNNLTNGEFALITFPLFPVYYFFLGLPFECCSLTLEYGLRKSLGRTPYHPLFFSTECINNWQDVKSVMKNELKTLGAVMLISAAISAATLTKKWLQARQREAERQP